MKHILVITIGLFLFSSISFAQDLDLNKANVNLKNNEKKAPKIDTIKRLNEIKFNYSYFSGLDFFVLEDFRTELYNDSNFYSRSPRQSGSFSLSFHHRVNKWKYGVGINYSIYRAQDENEFYYNHWNTLNNNLIHYDYLSYNIFTTFAAFERVFYKKLYLGMHLGLNFIRKTATSIYFGEVVSRSNFLPYTKICLGYQFKLSNRLNFNLELGAGGSMTNTGFSYMVR
jgi:hypothetical protein